MNIGDKYFCSSCLHSLMEEGVCPYCGHDPRDEQDEQALEEGTVLRMGRYQIGAVYRKREDGFIYGAYDHCLMKPVFIVEYFPKAMAKRQIETENLVMVERKKINEYKKGMAAFTSSCESTFLHKGRRFEENDTLYFPVSD